MPLSGPALTVAKMQERGGQEQGKEEGAGRTAVIGSKEAEKRDRRDKGKNVCLHLSNILCGFRDTHAYQSIISGAAGYVCQLP